MNNTRNWTILASRGLPLLLVVAVALVSVWPLIKCLGCVADFGNDGLLINWIINTAGNNLYGLHSAGLSGLFQGNIFYPYTNVLAYSELFMISGAWAFPVSKIVQNPALVSGLVASVGQVLTLICMYVWWSRITGNKWAASLGTVAFGVSQIRLEYQVHLQMWSMQYWIAGTALIVDWIKSDSRKNWKIILGTIMIGLQMWESLLPVYFSAVVIVAALVVFGVKRIWFGSVLIAGIIFASISAIPVLTYLNVSQEFNYKRDVREAAHNSMGIEEPLTKFFSSGLYMLTGVSVLSLIRRRKSFTKDQMKNVFWLTSITFFSLVMAWGPVVKIEGQTLKLFDIPIPLPYLVAYYILPGFGAFRTPSRWMWLTGFSMSGLAAIGLAGVISNKRGWGQWVRIMLLIIVALLGGNTIYRIKNIPNVDSQPKVYKWLKEQPGEVLVELPGGEENLVTSHMIYSLYHGKYLIDGWSGFYPPEREKLFTKLNESYPDTNTENTLKSLGVDFVVIDKTRLTNYRERLKARKSIWEDEEFAVYTLSF